MPGKKNQNKDPNQKDSIQNTANQSKLTPDKKTFKSHHGKQTGGKPSVPQAREEDQNSNRNISIDTSYKHSTDVEDV